MGIHEVLNIIYRTMLVLIILFFLTKVMGKKQVSQLNIFDYIIGITIGSIAADISLDIEKSLIGGICSLLIYGFMASLISYVTMKSITLRRFIIGVPTVVVEKGKIIESGLKKSKIDVNELLSEARQNGYFNLDEIDYAIMESDGKISFLVKEEEKPVTKKDMSVKLKNEGVVANLIIDGVILDNNLNEINKDRKWLEHELKIQGVNSYKEVLLATLDNNNKFMIYKKNITSKNSTILE